MACVSPYLALCAFLVAASYIARALPHSAASWGLSDLRMFVWQVQVPSPGVASVRRLLETRRHRYHVATALELLYIGNFNNDL